ncbi:carbohydrate binding domain-containing protein [Coraliomargarita sp. W4R72]
MITRFLTTLATACLTIGTVTSVEAESEFAPLFPFVISHEAPDNVTSLSHLLDAPAGKHGFVRVEDGRFATDAGSIKFNATNLTGAANFPSHEDADRLADRLARFGMNCVRLHYFDAPYGNFRQTKEAGLYGIGGSLPGAFSADPKVAIPFDPDELDRLDYLVAALKKRGIYVNINLHVARFKKVISFFSRAVIDSEKEYAKALLTHVNPYTGLAYTDEPSVAMIEINNENSLLRGYDRGILERLPAPYDSELRAAWNEWLRAKYGSTTAMRRAWNPEEMSLRDEQVIEGGFDQAFPMAESMWTLGLKGATAVAAAENGVLKITVERAGKRYFPKLLRNGIKVKKGETYTVSFKIRRVEGTGKLELGTAIAGSGADWRPMGFLHTFEVGNRWTSISEVFIATDDSEDAQFQLTRFEQGSYEIDELSIQSGAEIEVNESQRLENGSIAILKHKAYASVEANRDYYQFLADVETSYWLEMESYIKDVLQAKAPVAGTQLVFSTSFIQAQLDYVDIHSYWTHPTLNGENWTAGNHPMVQSMNLIQGLAGQRVLGKPYTVSEYNHPYPNLYGAEAQPMLRAYGALQGWDGVFEYTWHHRRQPEPGFNSYFFSISERTDVLAHMLACAAIYLRGDVSEANETLAAPIDYTTDFERMVVATQRVRTRINDAGFSSELAFVHKVGVDLNGQAEVDPDLMNQSISDAQVLLSDTGELSWNREDPDACYFTINTEGTKLFTGFPRDRVIAMGDVRLKIGKTRMDWATVSLVSRFAEGGFGEENRNANILLTATGQALNDGMELKEVGDRSVAEVAWGNAPVMVEGISALVELPSEASRTRCYALNSNGERVQEVPVESHSKGCQVTISPEYQTIWYEIEVRNY